MTMTKKLSKRFFSALIIIGMILSAGLININLRQASASNKVNVAVTVHYFRYAGDYTGWNLWMWTGDDEGNGYNFDASTDSFGAVKTFTVPGVDFDLTEHSKSGIGFLIRRGEWAAQDVNQDRYVRLNEIKDNKAEIWLVQNDVNVYSKEEYLNGEIDVSAKILNATFSTSKKISVTLTNDVTEATKTDFKVYKGGKSNEGGTEVTGATISANKTTVTITLPADADFSKEYFVESVFYGTKQVNLNGIFGTDAFQTAYDYKGELGALYTKNSTTFKVWAPLATSVNLNLYAAGSGGTINSQEMTRGDKGVWSLTVNGDLNKTYYTYTTVNSGITSEAVDPYAKAVGVNGLRGMVVDLASTNPQGWETHTVPALQNPTDAVIYETHVREFTIDPSSGVSEANRGKYLGFTETDTKNSEGKSTGVAHLKELGITEIHILPMYDYRTVDETSLDVPQFNWGYDPENYNAPEGSYSSDPRNGEVRINELKQMIMSLHQAGIRVIMDVVYNHTSRSADSNLNLLVPGYYYRMDASGAFANGSGCGNETASERSMVRKFMVDSVMHWAKEYKLDGFRFDLMALHDITTMNEIRAGLDTINEKILVYGEGWTGGTSPLADSKKASQANTSKLDRIAVFSDNIRDAVKGSVFEASDKGYVQGKAGVTEGVKYGVVGSVSHSQVNSGKKAWAPNPTQTISYVSAHDNLTLWDKITESTPGVSHADRIKMNNLAAAIVMTSQGIPFFTAGEEMLRTKPDPDVPGGVVENSYKSPDSTNSIKWDEKKGDKLEVFEYYKNLIALRKSQAMFRMTEASDVQENIEFLEDMPNNVIGFTIRREENNVLTEIFVYYNANKTAASITLDAGTYSVFLDDGSVSAQSLKSIEGGAYNVAAIGALVVSKQTTLPGGGGNTTRCGGTIANSLKDSMLTLVVVTAAAITMLVVKNAGRKRKEAKINL